jgi:hypothetical protein
MNRRAIARGRGMAEDVLMFGSLPRAVRVHEPPLTLYDRASRHTANDSGKSTLSPWAQGYPPRVSIDTKLPTYPSPIAQPALQS